ncbi:FecR family protein [Siphonobacter aquaeclarae]|uniref:FecR family protein n=1 Tax=Siphonobacter aquaeclarae TaxID=563176 RepID=A0A1G9ICP7_9BACT|nr:FecR domain-containing protein [Siphonobacter aquaeclarae]SDL22892.1 FecR family protein [Siphonobacter aquaeclarae]
MTRDRLRYLLDQARAGRLTTEETSELEGWYGGFDAAPDFTEGLSDDARRQLESRMLDAIHGKIDEPRVLPLRQRSWFRYAAVIAVVVLLAGGWFLYRPASVPAAEATEMVYTTGFGQTKTIVLPDRSEVILNGNSRLTYAPDWKKERKVWLSGEAFFKVVHTHNHQKFSVITADDFQVDVLGTQFVVSKRKSGTRVVLSEGKVQCLLKERAREDSVVMRPGDLVEFDRNPSRYTLKKVDPSLYLAWKDQKLIFRNTSLKEITQVLEDTYGFTVRIDDASLLQRRISGSVPTTNVELLLEGISEACQVKIRQEDRRIYLSDQR